MTKSFLGFLGLLLSAGAVYAASSLVVRVETPKTPISQNNFKLNFVALDMNNNVVTVKCFKQSPSDLNFVQFDTDKVLKAGGNSGTCSVDSSVLNVEGSYKFKVIATSDITSESSVVTVSYGTSTPDTPTNYIKDRTDSCHYTIKFKTANDGGKTNKVVVYRSDSLSFNADNNSQVESRDVGSDTWVTIVNGIPDCSKNYYYAVRAFGSNGLGSGIVGDEQITVVNGTTTTTSTTSNQSVQTNTGSSTAIPVESSTVTNPDDQGQSSESTKEIPVSSETSNPEILGAQTKDPFWKTNAFRIGVIIVLVGLFISQRKKGK